MKKRLFCLPVLLVTLILEILPYGAVCNFADETDGTVRKTFSYFSLVPYGYANFAPFLTAVITCAAVTAAAVYCFTAKSGAAKAAKTLICIAAILSLCPLLMGVRYYSVTAALISLTLAAEFFIIRHLSQSSVKQ